MTLPLAPVDAASLRRAVDTLKAGGVVAFPTETYYGLAVDPFTRAALSRLFRLKARPESKPVLVLIREASWMPRLAASTPDVYVGLMRRFWPGPLTLVFPARKDLPPELTAGSGGVGIRHSPSPAADRLLAAWGGPLTATSCNRSGEAPARSAREAARVFADAAASADVPALVLDDGLTPGGAGSTVVGLLGEALVCLREGRIAFTEVRAAALADKWDDEAMKD